MHFFASQFAYWPLVWMFHNRTMNNRINELQERAIHLVHNDNTSSFYELYPRNIFLEFTIETFRN